MTITKLHVIPRVPRIVNRMAEACMSCNMAMIGSLGVCPKISSNSWPILQNKGDYVINHGIGQ